MSMMDYSLKSVSEVSLADAAALFTLAFTGYIAGHVEMNATGLAALIARDNVDLNASRIQMLGEQAVGIALIARQGWSSRVAAMGIIPEMQGKKAGRWLLEQLRTEARNRSEKVIVLEAFEQNTRAVALYKGMGFEIVRRLYGYTADQIEARGAAEAQEIDPLEFGKQVAREGAANLPWQVSGATFMRSGAPAKAYQLGEAYALVILSTENVVLRGLFVGGGARKQGQAARMVRSLAALYPGRKWVVPQLCPEEYGGFFEQMGFQRAPLHQVQMLCEL